MFGINERPGAKWRHGTVWQDAAECLWSLSYEIKRNKKDIRTTRKLYCFMQVKLCLWHDIFNVINGRHISLLVEVYTDFFSLNFFFKTLCECFSSVTLSNVSVKPAEISVYLAVPISIYNRYRQPFHWSTVTRQPVRCKEKLNFQWVRTPWIWKFFKETWIRELKTREYS